MTERRLLVDAVAVPASRTLAREVPGLLELPEDAKHGALRDPHVLGDVPHPCARVEGDAEEHVRVVRQERPSGPLGHRRQYSFGHVPPAPATHGLVGAVGP